MNKNTKIAIAAGIVVLIAAAIFISVNSNDGNQNDVNSAPEQAQDNNLLELSEEDALREEILNAEPIPAPTPTIEEVKKMFNEEEFKVEFMTDAEKEAMGIDVSSRVQVLGRNADGQILGYKMIFSDEDVAQSLDEALR